MFFLRLLLFCCRLSIGALVCVWCYDWLVRTFCFVVAVCCCGWVADFRFRAKSRCCPPQHPVKLPVGKRVFQILESDKLSAMNSEYLNPCLLTLDLRLVILGFREV